mmetsp:Transcript_21502/g.20664  ORF Transcript_21502/g.20664 Transcript_21502/m.20664 type:complete len:80 (+) Transcript_21502:991-1230(+)
MQRIKKVTLPTTIYCFLECQGLLLCGGNEGNVYVVNMQSLEKIDTSKINSLAQIFQMHNLSKLAVAANNGLYLCDVIMQ